jgi:tRNA(Arg) A34 adenosine deaminase TadA
MIEERKIQLFLLLISRSPTYRSYTKNESNRTMMASDNREKREAGVVIDESMQKPPLTATIAQLQRMLQVVEEDILPKTEQGVTDGNKVFGAAVLDSDLKTVFAGTNSETTCPLFHGEVKVIYEWSQIIPAKERGPAAQSSIFLSTHEPCCMCISSIVWAGFPQVYYFFPYAVTSAQGIPHDINTMHELWGVNSYRKQNRYCSTACIVDLIDQLEDGSPEKQELTATQNRLMVAYDELSAKYHSEKAGNENNSLVLG